MLLERVLITLLGLCTAFTAELSSVWDYLESKPELSEFRRAVSSVENGRLQEELSSKPSSGSNSIYGRLTVFAPTNDAFALAKKEQFSSLNSPSVVKYHISDRGDLKLTAGQCPVYVLKMMTFNSAFVSSYQDEFSNEYAEKKRFCFVNNAMVLFDTLNELSHQTGNGYVYIVDRVLAPQGASTPAIGYLNANSARFSRFLELLSIFKQNDASRYYQITDAKNGTFFFPTDNAFQGVDWRHEEKLQAIMKQPSKLEDLIMSHFSTSHTYFIRAMGSNKDNPMNKGVATYSYDPYIDQEYVRVNTVRVSLTGKQKEMNNPMANGVVHVVNQILWPFDDIMEVMKRSTYNTEFHTLVRNEPSGNIDRELTWAELDPPPSAQMYTVISPTNEAITRAKNIAAPNKLHESSDRLDEQLRQHVLRGELSYADMKSEVYNLPPPAAREAARCASHTTLAGQGSNVCLYKIANETYISGAYTLSRVIAQWSNLGGVNGIIHTIDSMLGVPWRDVRQQLRELPIVNTTRELLDRFNFIQDTPVDVTGKRLNVTIFAPNDSYWQGVMKEPRGNEFMQDDITMNRVLRRHVIESRGYNFYLEKSMLVGDRSPRLPTLNRDEYLHLAVNGDTFEVLYGNQRYTVLYPNIGAYNGIIHIIDRAILVGDDHVTEMVDTSITLAPTILLLILIRFVAF